MELDYNEWTRYLIRTWEFFGLKDPKILDLACGTGNITLRLAKMGYEITGLDISAEMLEQAKHKANQCDLTINWYQQDMCQLNLSERYDVIICACDGLNYLLEENQLKSAFQKAYEHTKPGGLMLFDLNSEMKLREIYGNQSYAELFHDYGYYWDNTFDEEAEICQMDLTFFVPTEGDRYLRVSERHFEKLWRPQVVIDILSQVGWELLGYFAFPTWEEPEDMVERWQFVIKKM